ncbi:MAG: hypothetical protein AAFX87_23960 [Bacteroidota bacterium]
MKSTIFYLSMVMLLLSLESNAQNITYLHIEKAKLNDSLSYVASIQFQENTVRITIAYAYTNLSGSPIVAEDRVQRIKLTEKEKQSLAQHIRTSVDQSNLLKPTKAKSTRYLFKDNLFEQVPENTKVNVIIRDGQHYILEYQLNTGDQIREEELDVYFEKERLDKIMFNPFEDFIEKKNRAYRSPFSN